MSILVETLFRPLAQFYDQKDVEELRMNAVGVVIVVRRGGAIEQFETPDLSWLRIVHICQSLANYRNMRFDIQEEPNLSTTTLEGHRFECLLGASVSKRVSMTIRVKHPQQITLQDMGLDERGIAYLQNALDNHWNVVISGGAFTGKTTLLNNLLSRLPESRRVISAEDTPELETERFWQGVALYAAREESQGAGQRTYPQLFNHKMRASPDNIVFGEISIQNAKAALTALNTGARGFFCTVHAEGPDTVPQRFEDNINTANEHAGDVKEYMERLVDLVIQIRRCEKNGKRYISELFEMKNQVYIMKNGSFVNGSEGRER